MKIALSEPDYLTLAEELPRGSLVLLEETISLLCANRIVLTMQQLKARPLKFAIDLLTFIEMKN